MVGIAAICTEIPGQRLDTAERATALGIDSATLYNRIGVSRIARMESGSDTSDLCVAAARKLFASGRVAPQEVDCVTVVTQNPDRCGVPHTSAIVHAKLGLPELCACFDIGLGCSGYVYGLAIFKAFMEAQGYRRGLLFTADPYSKIVDENDRKTALLFGDAAAVTLLNDQPEWQVGGFDIGTIGSQGDALEVGINRQGRLFMDGRAVLAFSAQRVPESLRRAVTRNGLTMAEIDRVVLHQGSRIVVDTIAEELDLPGRIGFYAADYGNTCSSSIPIVLADHVGHHDKRIAIAGFGVGLSWASTVLTRVS
jgi:3-oxoacyl-[acyl-carrier-protein] synthase-3